MRHGGLAREMGRLLDLLMPPACLGCGGRLAFEGSDHLVCSPCLTRLRPLPSPGCPRCGFPLGTARAPTRPCSECADWPSVLRRACSAVVLAPPADALVHGLKYQGWRGLSVPMARRMAPLIRQRIPGSPGSTVLVPVPTSRSRARRRGYNQARALAEALAVELDGRVASGLERRDGSRTQISLQPHDRLANVQRAFRPKPEARLEIRGRHVLLVDDVLTTGATAGAAARALEEGGADEVSLVTFARALPRRRF